MRLEFRDEEEEPTHTITLATVILTNKVLDNVLSELADRVTMIHKIATMALDIEDDEISVRFMVKAIRKITSQDINTTFIVHDEDHDDE